MKSTIVVALAILSITISGCFIGPHQVTYLIPAPADVPNVVYPREAIANGHYDVQTICFAPTGPVAAPPSRNMAAFSEGDLKFCYLSPTVSGQKNNPQQLCESSLAPDPIDSPMTFWVFIGGDGVNAEQASGILQTNGQTITEPATVQTEQISESSRRWDLKFVFKQQCDPSAQYRLSLKGIASYGHWFDVPPVDFGPYTERFPMGRN